MDRLPAHQFRSSTTVYPQRTSGRIYLDYLRLIGRPVDLNEQLRAHILDTKTLSAAEIVDISKFREILRQAEYRMWFGEPQRPFALAVDPPVFGPELTMPLRPSLLPPTAVGQCGPTCLEPIVGNSEPLRGRLGSGYPGPVIWNQAAMGNGDHKTPIGRVVPPPLPVPGPYDIPCPTPKCGGYLTPALQEPTKSSKQQSESRASGLGAAPGRTDDAKALLEAERIKIQQRHEEQKAFTQRIEEKLKIAQQKMQQQKIEEHQQKMEQKWERQTMELHQQKMKQDQMELQKIEEHQQKIEEQQQKMEQKWEQEKIKQRKMEQERMELHQQKNEQRKMELQKIKMEQQKMKQQRVEQQKMEQQKIELQKIKLQKMELQKIELQKIELQKMEQSKTELPKAEQAKMEPQKTEHKKMEQPKLEQAKVDKVEQQKIERPKTEQPKIEQQKTEPQKMEQHKVEEQKIEHSKTEQQKVEKEMVELPPVKPFRLYSGASRSRLMRPTVRNAPNSDVGRNVIPQPEPSVHLESATARQETFCVIRQAIANVKKSEHSRTESIEKAPERKAEATEIEAVKKKASEDENLPNQSQPSLQKGSKDCDGSRLGERMWRKYNDLSKHLGQSHCSPNCESASKQPPPATQHHSKAVEGSACRTGETWREVSSDLPRSGGYGEAIRQSVDDLLNARKCIGGSQALLLSALRSPTASRSRRWAEGFFRSGEDAEGSGEAATWTDLDLVDLPSEWEMVDGGLADEGWSHVEEREVEERDSCWAAAAEDGDGVWSEGGSEGGSGSGP